MKFVEKLIREFTAKPVLGGGRIAFAFAVATITDAIQFSLGPLGWVLVDQGLDVLAMILISWAIGFHMLLLPTFVIELIPGPDMLPTWTGCTAAVVMLRKRSQQKATIDIQGEVTSVEPVAPDATAARKPPKISAPPPQKGSA